MVVTGIADKEIINKFDKINDHLSLRYQKHTVSLSGGFTRSKSPKELFDDYFKRADKALYRAKMNGKKQVVVE